MLTARDIMHAAPACVRESETLLSAACRMRDLGIGALPVCGDDGRLRGMVTDRDIVVKCLGSGRDPGVTTAGQIAQGRAVTVDADTEVKVVLDIMQEHRIRRLPVMESQRLVGMITEADLARNLADEQVGQFVAAVCY